MSTQPFEPKAAASAGLVQINSGIEDVIQKRLAEERMRLELEAGVVKRETNSWRWPIIMFTYMAALAYGAAFIVYQTAVALGAG